MEQIGRELGKNLSTARTISAPITPLVGRLEIKSQHDGSECLLWVISGHSGKSERCPLYPQKRTFDPHRRNVSVVFGAEPGGHPSHLTTTAEVLLRADLYEGGGGGGLWLTLRIGSR